MAFRRRTGEPRIENIALQFIDVSPDRRAPSPPVVERLAASMQQIGLKTPITLRRCPSEKEVGESRYALVTGAHRLAATKLNGWTSIDAFVIDEHVKDSDVELWEIDENLVRAELGAAEHALLTKRRAQIIENRAKANAAAEVVSQVGTAPRKNPNGGGRAGVTGRAAASIRDQAEKTGESKTKVARSKKRAHELGEETLHRVGGTSLDNGAQLDALRKLDAAKREALIKQAEAGEEVSAVRALAAEAAPSTEPTKAAGKDECHVALALNGSGASATHTSACCSHCGAPSNWRGLIANCARDIAPTVGEAVIRRNDQLGENAAAMSVAKGA
jgi:ParB/Sulfiredoxin domain